MFFHRSILQPVKEGCTFYDFCFKIIKNMREKQIQITARVLILLLSVLNVSYNVLVWIKYLSRQNQTHRSVTRLTANHLPKGHESRCKRPSFSV